ncbi:ABC transporter substrate-binding protein [Vibrio sp. TRT 17S01]|uniref:ABC transporter substrate-binding protein n=1 Tax=Vibrio sp. TRT 17S01 TaxID=3418505 RepID=UPI003CEF528C
MTKTMALMTSLLFSHTTMAQVEFLHWWTSQGEQRALNELKQELEKHNMPISMSPVTGGGGDSALTVLQARALAGNTPTFAQIEGPSIKAWDAIGILYNLNPTANAQRWEQTLYPLAIDINKTINGYVALPMTLHRLNWLWVNNTLLSKLQLTPPQTWEEMLSAMEAAKAQGIIPLAIGEQPWQIAQLFESLIIAYGGVEFYKTALVQLKPEQIDSPQMRRALKKFRRLSLLLEKLEPNQKWDTATQALAEDRALFQLGGDWILGDLLARGKSVPQQIACYPAPQSHDIFLYNMDSFIFMSGNMTSHQQANKLATIMANRDFQIRFNKLKGSIPPRLDIDMRHFNDCQQQSYQDFKRAVQQGRAAPSMTDSMALNPVAQQAMNSAIFRFYRDKSVTADDMIKRIIGIAESN